MSFGGQPAGLSLAQAPPLSVPLTFFLTAPCFLCLAGLWVLWHGELLFLHPAVPATLVLTHLGTLGVLTMTMCGALYQMLPVVVARPVPNIRLAHLVHLLLTTGGACLLCALQLREPALFGTATGLLLGWLLLFLWPMARALGPGRSADQLADQPSDLPTAIPMPLRMPGAPPALSATAQGTLRGMRLSLLALAAMATAGLCLALLAGGMLRGAVAPSLLPWHIALARAPLLPWHIALALVAWVGGLITAVSWQVVPMFYLTPEIPPAHRRRLLHLAAAALLLPTLTLLTAAMGQFAGALSPTHALWIAALPGAFGVWLYNPWLLHRAVVARRRKLPDASLGFWRLGIACAPICLLCGAAAILHPDPRLSLAAGWLCIWGWAGTIVLGMLHRIVPFLVWFHRCSPLIGAVKVPSARQLLPDTRTRQAYWLHALTLLLGLAAIATGNGALARLTGLGLLSTGVRVGVSLARVARYRPPDPQSTP